MASASPKENAKRTTCFSFALSEEEADALKAALAAGNYVPRHVQHCTAAVDAPSFGCSVALYASRKCVVQGKGAWDFVENVMEPLVLRRIILPAPGGEDAAARVAVIGGALSEEALSPHAGVDESGKGDFFGPLVTCAAYADSGIAPRLLSAGARDSKSVTDDEEAIRIASRLRSVLGPGGYALGVLPPRQYNLLYAKYRSANRILALCHARCIENLRATRPGIAFAVSDQFGDENSVKRAMRKTASQLEIRSRPRAESDIAVAAASLIAREAFLSSLADLSAKFGETLPKGAVHVRSAAERIVRRLGAGALAEVCKCHFRTTDQVLRATGRSRADMPPDCAVASPAKRFFRK